MKKASSGSGDEDEEEEEDKNLLFFAMTILLIALCQGKNQIQHIVDEIVISKLTYWN